MRPASQSTLVIVYVKVPMTMRKAYKKNTQHLTQMPELEPASCKHSLMPYLQFLFAVFCTHKKPLIGNESLLSKLEFHLIHN